MSLDIDHKEDMAMAYTRAEVPELDEDRKEEIRQI